MMQLVTVWLLLVCAGAYACPDGCTCDSKVKVVTCPDVDYDGLVAVVANLTANTTGLVIGGPQGLANVPTLKTDTFDKIKANGLTNLTIDSAGLGTIQDHAFLKLTQLKSLVIRNNTLTKVSSTLVADTKLLTKLTITMTNVDTISTMDGGENLEDLDLSQNRIKTIETGALANFTKLKTLNLSFNELDVISSVMFQGIEHTLIDLDLSQSTPPKTVKEKPFGPLRSLETLKFSGIGSQAFNASIFNGLTSLTSLDISRNGLTEVPFQAMGLFDTGLTELVFDDNNMAVLNGFGQLTNLQTVSLQRTGIKVVNPGPFRENPKLVNINMKGNSFSKMPNHVFANMLNLKTLDLSGCGLENIENGTFLWSSNLESLTLAGSKLTNLTAGVFDPLANLRDLDLSFSSIKSIGPGVFAALKKLKILNLDLNLIEKIPDDLLEFLKDNNVTVKMSHNMWDCSCEAMEKTKEWLDQSKDNTSMICSSPDALKGQDVSKVSKGQICYAPNITNCCHMELKAEFGENITFFCNATGSPKPDIKYGVISGNPLPANMTVYSADKTMVTVYNVTNANNGNFTCFATNPYGNITNYFEMFVFTPDPTFEPSKPYKKGSLLWIILGVAIGLIFIVTIIGLVVYFVRRRDGAPTELLVNSMENNVEA